MRLENDFNYDDDGSKNNSARQETFKSFNSRPISVIKIDEASSKM